MWCMTTTTDSRRYLSVGEAAQELRLSRQSVYRAVSSGSLPAVQLSPHGALRIPVEAIEPRKDEQR